MEVVSSSSTIFSYASWLSSLGEAWSTAAYYRNGSDIPVPRHRGRRGTPECRKSPGLRMASVSP
jgi:hypothetical protein